MSDPVALGAVLAMLTDRAGKPVGGGSLRGQLYASRDAIAVVKPTAREEMGHRLMTTLLLASIVAVVVNVAVWRSTAVIWAAVIAQAIYWFTLPVRRRSLEPAPMSGEALEAARRAGRVAFSIPAGDVRGLVAPEPPRTGFRKPARLELPDGALEMYLSPERFAELRAAIGR